MKILVIDDDVLTRKVIFKTLNDEGYEVLALGNAYEALELLESKSFDLIITDIMMPGISGLEMVNILKRVFLNKVPLIIITSLKEEEVEKISFELGAFAFMQKPLNINLLLEFVNKAVKSV